MKQTCYMVHPVPFNQLSFIFHVEEVKRTPEELKELMLGNSFALAFHYFPTYKEAVEDVLRSIKAVRAKFDTEMQRWEKELGE